MPPSTSSGTANNTTTYRTIAMSFGDEALDRYEKMIQASSARVVTQSTATAPATYKTTSTTPYYSIPNYAYDEYGQYHGVPFVPDYTRSATTGVWHKPKTPVVTAPEEVPEQRITAQDDKLINTAFRACLMFNLDADKFADILDDRLTAELARRLVIARKPKETVTEQAKTKAATIVTVSEQLDTRIAQIALDEYNRELWQKLLPKRNLLV